MEVTWGRKTLAVGTTHSCYSELNPDIFKFRPSVDLIENNKTSPSDIVKKVPLCSEVDSGFLEGPNNVIIKMITIEMIII